MGIAFGRVEEQIDDAGASDVCAFGRDIGEDDSRRDGFRGPGPGEGHEVLFA